MTQLAGRRVGFLVFGVLTLGLAGSWLHWQFGRPAPVAAIDYRNGEVVAQGKAAYAELCASCHGSGLEGQANWRERRA